MSAIKFLLLVLIGQSLTWTHVSAADDVDWVIGVDPFHKAGSDSIVEAYRWSLGSRRSDVVFTVTFDALSDFTRGNWYGEITAPERFYVKLFLRGETGSVSSLEVDGAAARGPDAEHGSWKSGPATAAVQSMTFDLTREKIAEIGKANALIVRYSSFDRQDVATEIIFPLQTYNHRLTQLDDSIQGKGGAFYLKTRAEIEAMPLRTLPAFVLKPLEAELPTVSARTSRSVEELKTLSMSEIKALMGEAKAEEKNKRYADRRAEHQEIYDQKPDWMDLNLCPKSDLSYCSKIGHEAYADDIFVSDNFTYGRIQGVVWRSEGSIVRIYGGSVELDIDPEIYRAKTAAYYYVIKSPKGHLDIRSAENVKTRP